MNKFEQLHAELEKIKQEAAQREVAKRAVRLEEEQRKAAKQAKELETQKIIKENWRVVKEQTLRVFEVINKEVLESKGKIGKWRNERANHYHYTVSTYGGYETPVSSSKSHFLCQDHTEVADLTIKGVGKLFVFRILHPKKDNMHYRDLRRYEEGFPSSETKNNFHDSYGEYSTPELLMPWRVHLGFSTDERSNPCFNCSSFVLDRLEKLTPTLIQEEIEKSVVLQLQSLYQARYSPK